MSIKKNTQDKLNRITIAETWRPRMAQAMLKTRRTAKQICSDAGASDSAYNRAAAGKDAPSEALVVLIERQLKKLGIITHPHLQCVINNLLEKYAP